MALPNETSCRSSSQHASVTPERKGKKKQLAGPRLLGYEDHPNSYGERPVTRGGAECLSDGLGWLRIIWGANSRHPWHLNQLQAVSGSCWEKLFRGASNC